MRLPRLKMGFCSRLFLGLCSLGRITFIGGHRDPAFARTFIQTMALAVLGIAFRLALAAVDALAFDLFIGLVSGGERAGCL